jgi:hypothetical protein
MKYLPVNHPDYVGIFECQKCKSPTHENESWEFLLKGEPVEVCFDCALSLVNRGLDIADWVAQNPVTRISEHSEFPEKHFPDWVIETAEDIDSLYALMSLIEETLLNLKAGKIRKRKDHPKNPPKPPTVENIDSSEE